MKKLNILIVLLFLCAGLAFAGGPMVNIPGTEGYDPNYPPTRVKEVTIPDTYKGVSPAYTTDNVALFFKGQWSDPKEYYDGALAAARGGDPSAQGIIDQDKKHSVGGLCDDNLVGFTGVAYFSKDGSMTFTEGDLIFHFDDGSSSPYKGVRVNMTQKPLDPHAYLRSSRRFPLKVSREQNTPGKDYVAVVFLFDRSFAGKKLQRIEVVDSDQVTLGVNGR